MTNNAAFSNCRDEKCGSKKTCVCGSHNANNVKKNKKHHATQEKLLVKKLRRFIKNQKDIEPEIVAIVDKHFWELI